MSALKSKARLWEVDFLRGIAVIMMLVSNFVFDLSLFSYLDISASLFWPWLARLTAGLFLLLVGISLTLSFSSEVARKAGFPKALKRGLKVFLLGLAVSAATWYAVGDDLVVFGILHLIGVGIILAYPFLNHKYLSLLGGCVVLLLGVWVKKIVLTFPWLVWLGFQYDGFGSVDYTPILPWFGFILIGIFLGKLLFPSGGRTFKPPLSSTNPLVRSVQVIGGKSLLIYFVHQPIFWSGFWIWRQVAS